MLQRARSSLQDRRTGQPGGLTAGRCRFLESAATGNPSDNQQGKTMSAYMCTPEKIAIVAAYVGSEAYNHETGFSMVPDEVAAALWKQNVRSVAEQYNDDPISYGQPPTVPTEATSAALTVSPVAILKMASCIEYQSCETEDWLDTVAYNILQRARAKAIRRLPGYESAPREVRQWRDVNPSGSASLSAMI